MLYTHTHSCACLRVPRLQALMTQVLAHAPHGPLPEDLQWSVRSLLPRQGSGPGFTTAAAGNASLSNAGQQAVAPAPTSIAPAPAPVGSFTAGAQQQGYTPQQLAMMQQVGSPGRHCAPPQQPQGRWQWWWRRRLQSSSGCVCAAVAVTAGWQFS